MPYINFIERDKLETLIQSIQSTNIASAGQLNFVISKLLKSYWQDRKNYQAINDIVGALEGAKAEFQRRTVALYEDQKIKENGDI